MQTISTIQQTITPLLRKYRIQKAALFGSVVENGSTEKNDIDILIEPPKHMTLFDMAGLQIDLEERLQKPVDLVTYRGINPRIKHFVLNHQREIYEKR